MAVNIAIMAQWTIFTIENGRMYFLKTVEKNERDGKKIWTAMPDDAKTFNAKGTAEYYAISLNVRRFSIKTLP
jgi:hypothetical protein